MQHHVDDASAALYINDPKKGIWFAEALSILTHQFQNGGTLETNVKKSETDDTSKGVYQPRFLV